MKIHLVHHYGPGECACGYQKSEMVHDRTVAFTSLPEAERHAAEHGMDVDTVEIPDLFTLDELELIVAAVDAMKPSPVNNAPIHARLRSLRVKAASLAFGQVTGV